MSRTSGFVDVVTLSLDAMLARYAFCHVCVCCSLCVSVTYRYCIKTAKSKITQTTSIPECDRHTHRHTTTACIYRA